jgi:hypothetical protein
MAKAQITTPLGIQVKLEGTPAEITAVLRDLESKGTGTAPSTSRRSMKKGKVGRVLLVDQLDAMINDGFFKKPKDLASIKSSLAEMGHHYPVTTLSPVMLRLVRRRALRRIRGENKRWVYVN